MRVDDQHAELLELPMPSLGQCQSICDASTRFVWPSEDVERQCEVSRAPCHRSDDSKIVFTWESRGTRAPCAARRHETKGRLVGAYSAIVRRNAQRAPEIRAKL